MKIAIVSAGVSKIPSEPGSIYAPGQIMLSLANGLTDRGHDVTLFGAIGSKANAKLRSYGIESCKSQYDSADKSLFTEMRATIDLFIATKLLDEHKKNPFDIIHAHDYRRIMFLSKYFDRPLIYTHHGDPEDDAREKIDQMRFKYFFDQNYFVGITDKQIELGKKWFNYIGRVYNAVDTDLFKFNSSPEDKLLFAGRMTEFKNPLAALEAAEKSSSQIILAGEGSGNYWQKKILPYKDKPFTEFMGHVEYATMPKIYARSKALIMPITWAEPFGMVVIEAMACGTPVIAYDRGSMPELIEDGVTGFIVKENSVDGLVNAIKKIDSIDRMVCRQRVREKFSINEMLDGYEKIYNNYLSKLRK